MTIEEWVSSYSEKLYIEGKYDELLMFTGYLGKCVSEGEVLRYYEKEMVEMGYFE